MSNDLQNKQNNMLDMFMGADSYTGLEEIDSTDLTIAKIKLLQAMSEEVGSRKGMPGQFYNAQTGEAMDEIECYLLRVGKSRAMFKQPYVKGSRALCSSVDCKMGTTAEGKKKSCVGCPNADWGKAQAAGKTKPDCNQSYVLFGATYEDGTPFRFTCSGDAVKVCKAFINSLMYKKMPLFVHKIKITASAVSNNKGNYFVPKFEFIEAYDANMARTLSPEVQKELCLKWGERQSQAEGLAEFYSKAMDNDNQTIDDSHVVDEQNGIDIDDETGKLF